MRCILSAVFTLLFAVFAIAQDLGKIDDEVRKQIGATLVNYYELKDAMVASDAARAKAAADKLWKSYDLVNASKMTPVQKAAWVKLEPTLRLDTEHIIDNDEIGHQRDHFKPLSNSIYALVFNFKANDSDAYLLYCPMKKASWLSRRKTVENPYYGNKMLDCGSVTTTLKKQPKN